MITNFDYLKKESEFSTFADTAISAEKIIFDGLWGKYFE